MTNNDRAERCARTIRQYNDEWDEKSNLIDLLADARHWCDRKDLSFAELDRIAYDRYVAELYPRRDEEGGQAPIADSQSQRVRDAAPELLLALDYLLEQTVDMDLKYGIGLSEGEEDARAKALSVIAKATE